MPATSVRRAHLAGGQGKTLSKKSFDPADPTSGPARGCDPLWEAVVRVFREANAASRLHTSKTIEGIILIARLYLREGERWEDFLAERGVRRPRRGPIAKSRFHGLAKHVLEIESDDDGEATRLAAVLDHWHAQRDRIAPDQIAEWIVGQGGLTNIYDAVRERPDREKWHVQRWREQTSPGKIAATNVNFKTSTGEYITPAELFAVMEVRFDQDVCSPGAQIAPWIPADNYCTRREDGLKQPWTGFVWMNPVFGVRNGIMNWIEKFIRHGNGVALVPDFTSAKWWHYLTSHADAIFFVKPKITFIRGPGAPRITTNEGAPKKATNALGTTLVAIGEKGVQALQNAERNGRGICFYRITSDPEGPAPKIPAGQYTAQHRAVEGTDTPDTR
jgi:hypothetical protein